MKNYVMTALLGVWMLTTSNAHAETPYREMPAGTYVLDKAHASLIWKVSHLGLSDYTARFTDFDATLTFDPLAPEKSSVVVTIDPTSIETDYVATPEKDFNKKLVESDKWFNAGAFPKISFTSTSITKTGEFTGKMTGNLTLLGVTKPATLDVTFNKAMAKQPFTKQPALGFSATGTIKRSDWGFDTYIPTIGDEIDLIIETEFNQKSE